jgi:cyclase
MLKKRIIFTLLYSEGYFVLSRNFRLQRVGDKEWLKKNYDFSTIAFSIDELIVLDVSRNSRIRPKFCADLKEVSADCFVPIAAGGGIRSVADAREILSSGADKVVLNSLFHGEAEEVRKIVAEFGSQCIVASVDVKRELEDYRIYEQNGQIASEMSLSDWLKLVREIEVGEIYLNSIDRDGTGQGYEMSLLEQVPADFDLPLIMAGGVGNQTHMLAGITIREVDAVATAHLFNFVGDGLRHAREHLIAEGIPLPHWDIAEAISLKDILAD